MKKPEAPCCFTCDCEPHGDYIALLEAVAEAARLTITATPPHNWKGDQQKSFYVVSREQLMRLIEALAALNQEEGK